MRPNTFRRAFISGRDSLTGGCCSAYSENELKNWVEQALDILRYLHEHHGMSHCDFKAENMLLFGLHRNQLRVCDLESARKWGEPRSVYVSPYICAPEVAKHVVAGGRAGLRVSAAEDIWALVSVDDDCQI